jgi:DNA-directed RNA polymerase specialized sigma24 family protein
MREHDSRAKQFTTTHWSAVLAAGHASSPGAERALAELCQTYWPPLYAYLRRRGQSSADAKDLTQEFFCRLIQKRWLDKVVEGRGRFRAYLLTAMNHFLTNEWERATSQKRGGGAPHFSLSNVDPEGQYYSADIPDSMTPDKLFARRWAETVLGVVIDRLQSECELDGARDRFDELKVFLVAGAPPSYADVAGRLKMTESALKSAIHRLRRRFAELLREEVGRTVATPGEVEEELRDLLSALS